MHALELKQNENNEESARQGVLSKEVYVLPASYTQRRYLILEELAPGNPALIMALNFRLTGDLNIAALKAAINALVCRHEVLRTAFKLIDGAQMQVVTPSLPLGLPMLDLSGFDEKEKQLQTQQRIREENLQPFDLAHAPLFRVRLLKVSPAEHILQFSLHHIICDGWSNGIVVRDLASLYSAQLDSTTPPLPELPIQFADFAAWEQQRIDTDTFKHEIDFWVKQARDSIPMIDFPTDRSREGIRGFRSEQADLNLAADRVEALKAFCNRENLTLYMVFLAAFEILLHRYSGQTDIVVGSPAANRSPETEELIGPFANPIILRADLSGDPTVSELLKRIRATTLEALKYQKTPFDKLLEELDKRQVKGLNRLFQFTFLFQRAFMQPHQLPGVELIPLPSPHLGAQSELFFGLVERKDGIRVQVPYLISLFDESTVVNILNDYERILTQAVASPSMRISELKILGPQPESAGDKSKEASALPAPTVPAKNRKPDSHHRERRENRIVEPCNALQFKLRKIWESVLGISPIGVTDNFLDLGGHSYLAVRLLAAIEKEWGRRLPMRIVFHAPTIEQMAAVMENEGWKAPSFSLITIQHQGTRPPLFCVSAPGGGIPYYNTLSKYLGPDQPIYAFHPLDPQMVAGAEKREFPMETRLSDTAALYIKELRTILPNGPFYLCGHSWGGTVAYIIALELRKLGLPVAFLGLFDTQFYGYNRRHSKIRTLWLQMKGFARMDMAERTERVGRVFSRSVNGVKQRIKNLIPNAWVSREHGYQRVIQAEGQKDRLAVKNYQAQPYHGRLTLFRCTEQSPWLKDDTTLGWKDLAVGGMEVISIPGHHGNLVMEPGIQVLAAELKESMDRCHNIQKPEVHNQPAQIASTPIMA